MKKNTLVLAACVLSACGVLPRSAPQLVQHDLGSAFESPAGRGQVPLRGLTVTAAPIVGGLSMYYREAAQPTKRGVYAYNRWAAPPASMVENALVRLLPLEPGGRCRLTVHLADFIVEIGADGAGSALLAAELRLAADARPGVLQRVSDLRVPVPTVDPASAAQALREAVRRLGDETAAWIGAEAGSFCRS